MFDVSAANQEPPLPVIRTAIQVHTAKQEKKNPCLEKA